MRALSPNSSISKFATIGLVGDLMAAPSSCWKFGKNNIFLRPEEAMFVELVKACLPKKNILFQRKFNLVHFGKKKSSLCS